MSKNTIEDISMKDLEDMTNEELCILAREEYEEFPKMSNGWKAMGTLCARIYTQSDRYSRCYEYGFIFWFYDE